MTHNRLVQLQSFLYPAGRAYGQRLQVLVAAWECFWLALSLMSSTSAPRLVMRCDLHK